MADCRDIQIAVAQSRALTAPDLRAHLDRCAACRELTGDGGALGRALGTPGAGDAGSGGLDLDAMFSELETRVAEERGPGAWLRSRPTGLRLVLAVAIAAGAAAGLGLLLPGRDLAALGMARAGASVAILAVVAVAAIAMALWPLHHSAPGPRAATTLILLAVGAPVALALWPAAPVLGPGEAALGLSVRCFGLGALTALPVWLVVRAADRHPTGASIVLGAAAAGLAGTLGLELGCPHEHPLHLLLGHATVTAAFVGAGAGVLAFRDRRAA